MKASRTFRRWFGFATVVTLCLATPRVAAADPGDSLEGPSNLTVQTDVSAPSVTLTWEAPAEGGGEAVQGYRVTRGLEKAGQWEVDASTYTFTFYDDVVIGEAEEFGVCARRESGVYCSQRRVVVGTLPGAPTHVTVSGLTHLGGTFSWEPPTDVGVPAMTHYEVYIEEWGGKRLGVNARKLEIGANKKFKVFPIGRQMKFVLRAVNAVGSTTVELLVTTPSDFPRVMGPIDGKPGGKITATARWRPPRTYEGDAPILGYRVRAYPCNKRGNRRGDYVYAGLVGATVSQLEMRLPKEGRWRFSVQAANAGGMSRWGSGWYYMIAIAQ